MPGRSTYHLVLNSVRSSLGFILEYSKQTNSPPKFLFKILKRNSLFLTTLNLFPSIVYFISKIMIENQIGI